MAFDPTPEQAEIIRYAREETTNLAVIARAGAAKTSTLVLIAEALPKTDILCLAFNKAIANEMTERLPSNCTSKTLHGLGYGAWGRFIGKKIKLNDRKSFQLLKEACAALSGDDAEEMRELFSETLDYIGQAKNNGYLPNSYRGHWKPLITDPSDFYPSLPTEVSGLQQSLIDEVLVQSFKAALQGEIDFNDMVYCPAICSVSWPYHDLYLVDEAQDLSALNHHILKKMVRNRRLIAVGDPFQAIYGFRGADTKSLSTMTEKFSMEHRHLTITFRCGTEIVEHVKWRAPDIQAPEWQEPGEVKHLPSWSVADIPDGSAVICRNNAPLFKLAITMFQHGKMPEIRGRDLAGPLKKIMRKLGKDPALRAAALDALEHWKTKELKRAHERAAGQVHDKAACIKILLEKTKTLGDAIAYLDFLLTSSGRVYLMTGHKSKGLEYDEVFFLEAALCNPKYEQDLNLKYVIQTRAKKRLTYITFDGMLERAEEEVD
jgi:superfamily I DNA/RNA helicase